MKYLSIGLIWIGVGIASFGAPEQVRYIALGATLATLFYCIAITSNE